MYKKIQIVGLGPYYLPVIYDILIENGVTEQIRVFSNIKDISKPETPIKDISIEIIEPGVRIDHEYPLVFGVSGADNKITVFKYFNEIHAINENNFITVIDKSAAISIFSRLGQGCFIEQNVSVSAQCTLGFGVSIKRNASVGHHSRIGDFVDINPGATIAGKVTIGNNCTIGTGAVVLDGVNIGNNSFIGAGSVVTKDVPGGVVAYGNPCKIIRKHSVF